LRTEVAASRFRGDLYFRLNVIPVRIPPLRERPEDVLPLARHFLAFYSVETGRSLQLTPAAERALLAYPWHGNVRELENAIERAVVMSVAELLTPDSFALEGLTPEPPNPTASSRTFSSRSRQQQTRICSNVSIKRPPRRSKQRSTRPKAIAQKRQPHSASIARRSIAS
jgi:DNA-binding NtrC family response regulator